MNPLLKNKVKQAIGYHHLPQLYSKEELLRKQVKLQGIISWAITTKDADLLETCYILAKEYILQKGYAQNPNVIGLEQLQNTDESIERVIKKLREEQNRNPTTGTTTQEQAKQLLQKAVQGGQ